jgi:hypothetical protein
MVPFSPNAIPLLALEKVTSVSVTFVPLDCAVQVAPPSMVRRIVPFLPTAVPILVSVKNVHEMFSCGRGFLSALLASTCLFANAWPK